MIEFRNVSKIYNTDFEALRNVSLHVSSGEFVFIVGSSGAGKSTFMNLLLKETQPDEGVIFVNSKDISKIKPKQIPYYKRQFGVVFQDYKLLNDLTVFDNVAFAMQIVEASKKEILNSVNTALNLVHLNNKANSYPDSLSGGEQQRIAIARALVNNPTIFVADEPTGNLDANNAIEIIKILNEINRRGTTVLVATHNKEIVNQLQKRVVRLDSGKVIADVGRSGYFDEM